MPTPDFFQSRRQLRRSRLQDALGLPREGVNIELHRNRLIEPLVIAADSPITDFGSLPQTTVDTVVSLALTELDETPIEALLVVLLCIRILAANGEFARLSLLAGRLQSLCRLITIDRPYLSAATAAFGLALQSREQSAVQILLQRLGISGTPEPAIASSREQINDILMATTLQRLLVTDDRAFAEKARYAAITTQDGFLLAYIEAITTWHEAADRARPIKVLVAADPTFADPALVDYLTRRRIRVLFPPQIKAIRGGATHDQNRVVSLPTSSGKTLLAEFRIAAALTRNPGTRAIYVAPYRMLARQVEHSFRTGLGPLKITVKDLGSGFDPSFDQTADVLPDVSICTPERLDALLRVASTETPNGLSASQLFGSTNVVIFDELQLVGRPGRGPRF